MTVMRLKFLPVLLALVTLIACKHHDYPFPHEDPSGFTEISTTDLGEVGAAEISAFDPGTKKLFTVTNAGTFTQIDVIDLTDPATPVHKGNIDVSSFGGNVNSVSVSDGKLAAAIEGFIKTDAGKVVIFKTSDHSVVKSVTVGALPDMIAYSYDGKYILTANEGEPSDDYVNDPLGTVSIISVKDNYAVTTLDFSSFASQQNSLMAKGLRVFGLSNDFAKDMEPEYLTISHDSRTAWVTLQENNAIAKIDIRTKKVTDIFPLGFKSYNLAENAIDPSDRDSTITPRQINVKGMYLPDGISLFENGGTPFLFTVNEGDVREYSALTENKRIKDIKLDSIAFPTRNELKKDPNLGRLNITTTLGDKDNDGDFDELYSFGARSFSVWNGYNGKLVFDSKNSLEKKAIEAGFYDDGRSDDKGVEPEGITLGYVDKRVIAFLALERSDAIAIYDVTNPYSPSFIKILKTGDAPEGVLFISAKDSPTKKSLLVVSSEDDGTVRIYETN